jgi:hypothetical protein
MKLPRFSIAWIMFGIAMLCVIFALLKNAMAGHLITGQISATAMGLWPGLVAFGIASFSIARNRGNRSPFLWGFAIVGWSSVLVYLAFCFWMPRVVQFPVLYYLNEIDYWWIVWLIDSERYEVYILNLLVLGLFLATPQLMMATLGGLIARGIWGTRWNTT